MCKSVRTHLAYQKSSVHVRFSNVIDGQAMRGLIDTGNLQCFLRGAGGTWLHRPWAYTDQETPGCLGENWEDIKGQSHPLHICLRQALDASVTCEGRVAPRYLTKLFCKNQQQGVLWAAFLIYKDHLNLLFFLFLFFVLFLFFKFYLFIYGCVGSSYPCEGFSLVAASGGHPPSRCAGLSLSGPLLLRSTGSRRAGSAIVAHGPSRSAACGILPDQGSNPCPLHWQADSQPLRHPGSPKSTFK